MGRRGCVCEFVGVTDLDCEVCVVLLSLSLRLAGFELERVFVAPLRFMGVDMVIDGWLTE